MSDKRRKRRITTKKVDPKRDTSKDYLKEDANERAYSNAWSEEDKYGWDIRERKEKGEKIPASEKKELERLRRRTKHLKRKALKAKRSTLRDRENKLDKWIRKKDAEKRAIRKPLSQKGRN